MANPRGRPSKFPEGQEAILKLLYQKGCTDKEVAEALGVTEQTVNNWKLARPEFFESLKDWRLRADGEVERSLFERATGYACKETKVFNNGGEPLTVDVIKHYPPDTAAAFIWLQNRKPNEWKREPKSDVSGEPITIQIVKPDAPTD